MTTREVSKTTIGATTKIGACRHHWVIESPDGPVSHGSCRICGATKSFKNIIEAAPWRDDGHKVSAKEPIMAVASTDKPEFPYE